MTLFGESFQMVRVGSLDFQVAHTILTSKLDPKKETPKRAFHEIVYRAVFFVFYQRTMKKS